MNIMEGDIFKAFCHYVDDRIFSKENMGSYVAFVVDQSFVDDFCRENHTTQNALITSVRSVMWNYFYTYDHLFVKGLIAIQLFAASKRADSDNMTAQAYYGRLHQVIGLDVTKLRTWMTEYQDMIWSTLYKWCDNNHFLITRCRPRPGKGRYVQYPIDQAKRVFTEEDLLHIAKSFVDKHLYPGEDITEYDFWKIVDKRRLSLTSHATKVIDNSVLDDDYLSQIYNFYLRWNGNFKFREKTNRVNSSLNVSFAYFTDDLTLLEIRNENLKLLHCFNVNSVKYSEVQKHFTFRRNGILLFRKDDIYDNRWQEVRSIEADDDDDYTKESGNYGLLVCFKGYAEERLVNRLRSRERMLLREFPNILIFKITRRYLTEEFFGTKRFYELYGGFKIGRNTYLSGATPILRLHKRTMVWIDGNAVDEDAVEGDFLLNQLDVGTHYIKMPNAKSIKIEVVETTPNIWEWQSGYNKWQIGKKPALWQNTESISGIVGLDFSSVCDQNSSLDECVTIRWAKAQAFDEYHPNENNIAIKLTRP